MPQSSTHTRTAAAPRTRPSTGLGERVRQQRVARGLTQSDLAGGKFSKEYISQVELGKTIPTRETLEYLASRLAIDPGYLAHGVSSEDQARIEGMLARADALAFDQQFDAAIEAYLDATTVVAASGSLELEVRRLAGEAWARMEQGDVRGAIDLLAAARERAENEQVNKSVSVEVLWKLGVGRLKVGSTHVALGLLNEAYSASQTLDVPDRSRIEILRWRCVVYQRLGDIESAKADAELALELAEHFDDPRVVANAHFQASLVAEREGRFAVARTHAERARAKYEEVADAVKVGSVLNNLALLQFQLGSKDDALASLKRAYGLLLDAGDESTCGLVVATIASVHLESGEPETANQQARHALSLFKESGVEEHAEQIAETQLILAGALIAQGELDEAEAILREAESSFEAIRSTSNIARAVFTRGDVAARRGAHEEASRLYRRSAALLQDFRI